MTKPIDLYFWPTPNGWKITIALEEMGLPYAVKPVNIGRGEQFAPEFIAISPNNRMPAIVDPEGPGGAPIAIFESAVILHYLARKSGQFYPSDERARLLVDQWLAWQVANLGPVAGQVSHYVNYAPALVADPALIAYGRARAVNELNRLCGVMERRLGEAAYLGGDYSIADMAAFAWARIAGRLGQNMDEFPKLTGWIERIKARPAVKRGSDVGKDWRKPQTADDARESAKALFGQTAANVAEAVKKRAAQTP